MLTNAASEFVWWLALTQSIHTGRIQDAHADRTDDLSMPNERSGNMFEGDNGSLIMVGPPSVMLTRTLMRSLT
jgi:hypothetical protein